MEKLERIATSVEAAREVRRFIINVENLASGFDDNTYHVYVLECIQPFKDDEETREYLRNKFSIDEARLREGIIEAADQELSENTIQRRLENREYEYPNHCDLAIYADEIYYVGQTSDIGRRLKQHIGGDGPLRSRVLAGLA